MDNPTKIHESNDAKLIEIYTRLFYYDNSPPVIEELPEFISIYNDNKKIIGAAYLKADDKGVNAVLTFDYHSPERLSIELNDGYKYYAHPIWVNVSKITFGQSKKLLFILINTQKHEDSRISNLEI